MKILKLWAFQANNLKDHLFRVFLYGMRTEEELMFVWYIYFHLKGFSGSAAGKEFTCNAGDPGLIPGSGRCAGEGIAHHSSILGLPLWLSR